jgi:diguanylate cyclase (GGDEF)-like protein
MQQLLTGLADLTGLKDRQMMDLALVKLIGRSDLWRFTTVRLLRVVGPPEDLHWVTLGQWDGRQGTAVREEFWFDVNSLPRLADFAHREAALASKAVIHTGLNTFTTVFPVAAQHDVACVLEVESDLPVSTTNEAQIASVLHLYANLQSLLDYGEHDTLTELLNRKTFDSAFMRSTQFQANNPPQDGHNLRNSATGSYWLAVMDIDFFKLVNDNFGHLIGDEVLLLMARQIRASFRFNDQLYRFGGEEFVVLMRCVDHADAFNALERFRHRIEQYTFPQVGHITVSIGFAPLRDNDTPGGAFDRADKAVYYAKSHGRNQVSSFTDLLASGELSEFTEETTKIDIF